jgi:hypothetical protein
MWTFMPAIWKDDVLTELPRPVTGLRLLDSWDFEKFKTPLADGDHLAGHSRNGVDVQIEGQVGTLEGDIQADEAAMLQAIADLRSTLDVDGASGRYSLVLYHDPATGLYRLLQKCSTVRFESDLSNKSLFTYSVVVHASDPVLVTTALD